MSEGIELPEPETPVDATSRAEGRVYRLAGQLFRNTQVRAAAKMLLIVVKAEGAKVKAPAASMRIGAELAFEQAVKDAGVSLGENPLS